MRELPHDRFFVRVYEFAGQPKSWNIWGQMIDADTDKLIDWSGWFQLRDDGELRLGWPEASWKENLCRLAHVVYVFGKKYQVPDGLRHRVMSRVEAMVNNHPEIRDLAIGMQASVVATERPAAPKTLRGDFMENTNETKTAKAPKVTFGQCQVVPRPTSKAGETRCPRMITAANEYNVCLGHLAFIKRGSETKLLDGRILNPRPAAEPKSTEVKAEPAAQDTITSVAPAVPVPESKPVKLTKKQKVQAALAVLSAKTAAKNDSSVDTGMVQRSTPNGQ